jgi:hypothetical protein
MGRVRPQRLPSIAVFAASALLGACGGDDFASSGAEGAGATNGAGASSQTGWCADQAALFCDDFDDYANESELFEEWGTYSTVSGDLSFDAHAGVPSAPNALHAATEADSGVQAIVVKTLDPFASPPNKLRLEFSLRVDSAKDVALLAGTAFVSILTGEATTDGVIALTIGFGPKFGVGFVEPESADGTYGGSAATTAFPQFGEWLGRYALEVEYSDGADGRKGCAQMLVGGVPQLADCLVLPASLVDPEQVSIAVGTYSVGLGSSGDVEISVDNLLLKD